jgi:NAD(P)-dependent dehydrogenase (short-subunit alcohol dehydrogenase family)
MPELTGKRVLILGAETEIGRAVTTAVAEAGASVAAIAATSDAEAAFAVRRLARRLSSDERKVIAQAIDATNEAAVRVMVRQVSKELGGLDVVVHSPAPTEDVPGLHRALEAHNFLTRFGGRELDRFGVGSIILVTNFGRKMGVDFGSGGVVGIEGGPVPQWRASVVGGELRNATDVAAEIVRAVAGEADSG